VLLIEGLTGCKEVVKVGSCLIYKNLFMANRLGQVKDVIGKHLHLLAELNDEGEFEDVLDRATEDLRRARIGTDPRAMERRDGQSIEVLDTLTRSFGTVLGMLVSARERADGNHQRWATERLRCDALEDKAGRLKTLAWVLGIGGPIGGLFLGGAVVKFQHDPPNWFVQLGSPSAADISTGICREFDGQEMAFLNGDHCVVPWPVASQRTQKSALEGESRVTYCDLPEEFTSIPGEGRLEVCMLTAENLGDRPEDVIVGCGEETLDGKIHGGFVRAVRLARELGYEDDLQVVAGREGAITTGALQLYDESNHSCNYGLASYAWGETSEHRYHESVATMPLNEFLGGLDNCVW